MSKAFPADYTAADIMTTKVVTVYADDNLKEVMTLLVENHVSGAPVIDTEDRCVGVVSATDILSYEQDHSEESEETEQVYDVEAERWETVRVSAFALESLPDVRVSEVMSRVPICVAPKSSIHEVAKVMQKQGVHRVVVVDADQQVQGIVSAFDFVRAHAKAGGGKKAASKKAVTKKAVKKPVKKAAKKKR